MKLPKSSSKLGIALALAAFVASALAVQTALAQEARSYDYARIDTEFAIEKDSTVRVTETQTFDFVGAYHVAERVIPHKGSDAITDISVEDSATHAPLTYAGSRPLDKNDPASWGKYVVYGSGGDTIIDWYYDLADTSHSWVVTYTLHGAIAFYSDHDELYWNLFDSYTVPIRIVSAKVVLPGTDTAPISSFYVVGDHTAVTTRLDDRTFAFSASNFAPGEAATIAVGWQKGLIPVSAYWKDLASRVWPYALAALILLCAVAYAIVYRKFLHPQKTGRTIVPEYEPPQGIPPAIGELIAKESSGSRNWPATIVDLAVRGYLTIRDESKTFLSFPFHAYQLERSGKSDGLALFEQELLTALFAEGTTFSTKEVQSSYSVQMRVRKGFIEARKALLEDATATGAFEHAPKQSELGWSLLALGIVALVLAIVFAIGFGGLYLQLLMLAVAVLVSAGIVYFVRQVEVSLSEKGKKLKDELLGFKLYLETAERYRLQNLAPDQFEKFLPYAMLFGVEKKWAKAFEGLNVPPPHWYAATYVGAMPSSPGSFDASSFASGFSASFATAFSSGAGGAAGGGGAGGGGGGGGGGAG